MDILKKYNELMNYYKKNNPFFYNLISKNLDDIIKNIKINHNNLNAQLNFFSKSLESIINTYNEMDQEKNNLININTENDNKKIEIINEEYQNKIKFNKKIKNKILSLNKFFLNNYKIKNSDQLEKIKDHNSIIKNKYFFLINKEKLYYQYKSDLLINANDKIENDYNNRLAKIKSLIEEIENDYLEKKKNIEIPLNNELVKLENELNLKIKKYEKEYNYNISKNNAQIFRLKNFLIQERRNIEEDKNNKLKILENEFNILIQEKQKEQIIIINNYSVDLLKLEKEKKALLKRYADRELKINLKYLNIKAKKLEKEKNAKLNYLKHRISNYKNEFLKKKNILLENNSNLIKTLNFQNKIAILEIEKNNIYQRNWKNFNIKNEKSIYDKKIDDLINNANKSLNVITNNYYIQKIHLNNSIKKINLRLENDSVVSMLNLKRYKYLENLNIYYYQNNIENNEKYYNDVNNKYNNDLININKYYDKLVELNKKLFSFLDNKYLLIMNKNINHQKYLINKNKIKYRLINTNFNNKKTSIISRSIYQEFNYILKSFIYDSEILIKSVNNIISNLNDSINRNNKQDYLEFFNLINDIKSYLLDNNTKLLLNSFKIRIEKTYNDEFINNTNKLKHEFIIQKNLIVNNITSITNNIQLIKNSINNINIDINFLLKEIKDNPNNNELKKNLKNDFIKEKELKLKLKTLNKELKLAQNKLVFITKNYDCSYKLLKKKQIKENLLNYYFLRFNKDINKSFENKNNNLIKKFKRKFINKNININLYNVLKKYNTISNDNYNKIIKSYSNFIKSFIKNINKDNLYIKKDIIKKTKFDNFKNYINYINKNIRINHLIFTNKFRIKRIKFNYSKVYIHFHNLLKNNINPNFEITTNNLFNQKKEKYFDYIKAIDTNIIDLKKLLNKNITKLDLDYKEQIKINKSNSYYIKSKNNYKFNFIKESSKKIDNEINELNKILNKLDKKRIFSYSKNSNS